MNGLVCSTGDQTWDLSVYLHNDKSWREPETLGDDMERELVKWPVVSRLCWTHSFGRVNHPSAFNALCNRSSHQDSTGVLNELGTLDRKQQH